MWIETDIGTFEIVEYALHRAGVLLIIRGETRAALEKLHDRYLPELEDIDDSSDEDLPFNGQAYAEDVAKAMAAMTRSLSTYQPSVMQSEEELLLDLDAGQRGSLRLVGKRRSMEWQYRLQWSQQDKAKSPVDWLATDPRYRWVYSWQETLGLLEACDGLRMRPVFVHVDFWPSLQQAWGRSQPSERSPVLLARC
ncbi:hypothetical protein SAMN05216201_11398 [Pseudomonas linyingensis]|uniref:Uncharacterized protein n=1 Tax=Pseudomonas linyingensis TaxID=915471 RepID=A0A1H7AL23_9PSED|nr:hypothetical protein [Pseudomonas linyingensis]SEJ66289.1 hypothetical protein SAMN05216201_11398 [Pseudomonas linyingensis]